MSAEQTTVQLVLTVLEASECVVAFEPEGAISTLAYGDAFTVLISGPGDSPGDGVVEVSYHPSGISIGAWPGALTRAWNKAGDELKL